MMKPAILACVLTALCVAPASSGQLSPAAWRDRDQSARIERLRREMAADPIKVDEFWAEIAKQGTPLVEPLGDKHDLVTFLWRGSVDTRNVVVVLFDFWGVRPQDHMMRRLGDTDVWFLTMRLPRAARFIYRLSPNNPLENKFFGDFGGESQLDPLNQRPFFDIASVAELSDAPRQPWIVRNPNAPAGTVSDAQTIRSTAMKQARQVWVYTPPLYQATGRPSDLIVFFDGRMYIDRIAAPTTLDNLMAAGKMRPTVAVFIETDGASRNEELFGNPVFSDFVAEEVMPWIRSRYNVTKDPRRVVIAGASAGGAAAAYVALRHSEMFGNVLSQSGGFAFSPERLAELAERSASQEPATDRHIVYEVEDRGVTEGGWLAKRYIESPKRRIRFYMDVGAFEADFSGGGLGALEPNRHMRDVLLAKGYEVHYQQFMGGHDYVNWRGTFADGVMTLLGER